MLRGLFQHQVALKIEVSDAEVLTLLEQHLFLPGWHWACVKDAIATFALHRQESGWFCYENQGLRLSSWDSHEVCSYLAGRIYHWIAAHSCDLFVHAGVVSGPGGAMLFPGRSMAGKSTLVRAMVEQGTIHFSDEFAVLKAGSDLIYPFARGLRMRGAAAELPSRCSLQPAPLRFVVDVAYEPSCKALELRPISQGEMALTLFQHAVAAQRFGGSGLQWLLRACQGAQGWSGRRSEALEAAGSLYGLFQS